MYFLLYLHLRGKMSEIWTDLKATFQGPFIESEQRSNSHGNSLMEIQMLRRYILNLYFKENSLVCNFS